MTEAEEAVRRFLAGDEAAFTTLVRQWETRVYNFAWRYTGQREDAQDVVQDTFLSAFRSLRSLRDPRSFPTWLFRIALNHCRARWRARTDDVSFEEAIEGGDRLLLESPPPGRCAAAGDGLETIDLIRKALAGLSDEHRSAIILKEYVGLNLEEIASVMQCPLSTAKSRLYHGLRSVQRNLKRMGVRR